jgi:hypothetical protein
MVGVLRDFSIDGNQLRADLHLLKSHEDFEKILEMAENMPGSFGLSISFSGESEAMTEGQIPSARCMEIYSADLVDQPAANPTGLFQSMPDTTTPEEVPVVAPVEEVLSEEVTPLVETVITSSEPVPETAPEVAEEVAIEVAVETEIVSLEDENLATEAPEVVDPVLSDEEAEKVIQTKLSVVVESFDLQKGEIISLRANLQAATIEITNLKSENANKDLRIASLEKTKRIALSAAGLLPSDVELEISIDATPFNAVEAYSAAVESGNKQLAADLFKDHKKAIFAARNGK